MRLTLWYVGAFSTVLILFSAGVYFFVERILVERMDANLRVTLQTTSAALARGTNQSTPAAALEDPRFPGQIVALVDADGRVLAKKPVRSAVIFRLPALPLRASASPHVYELPESENLGCIGLVFHQQYPRPCFFTYKPRTLFAQSSNSSLVMKFKIRSCLIPPRTAAASPSSMNASCDGP